MKIIFLSDFLPTREVAGGGLQNYTARVTQALHGQGEEIWVVCKSKNINYEQYPFPVKEIQISYKEKKFLQLMQLFTFHKIDNTLRLVLEAWAVRRECRKISGVDIIHSPNYHLMGLFIRSPYARLVVRASSYRPLWLKSSEVNDTLDDRFTSYLEGKLYKRADAVFAPSTHLASILEREIGRPVDVVPAPIPENSMEEDSSWYEEHVRHKKYILYFGSMFKRKGIFILAHAMQEVWKKNPEVLLIMAGPDMVVNQSSNIRRVFEIVKPHEARVLPTGQIEHSVLYPLIRYCTFVVLPSIEDNCPNSMLEAMSLGKAVIGTIGSSMDEFYPDDCSDLLAPRNDIHLLAERILKLWACSQEQLDDYGRKCKSYIEERHNLNRAALSLRNYYVQNSARR